jgi:hypothetical protein
LHRTLHVEGKAGAFTETDALDSQLVGVA